LLKDVPALVIAETFVKTYPCDATQGRRDIYFNKFRTVRQDRRDWPFWSGESIRKDAH
jgi:hypothetical protein